VHDRNEPGVRRGGLRVEEGLRIDRLAPGRLDPDHLGTAPPRDLAHALAEHTVDPDDHGVARFDEVDEARLHTRRARAGDGQGECVLGAEHRAEPVTRLVEDAEELGVEVADERSAERGEHLGVRVGRAGPEEEAIGDGHGGGS